MMKTAPVRGGLYRRPTVSSASWPTTTILACAVGGGGVGGAVGEQVSRLDHDGKRRWCSGTLPPLVVVSAADCVRVCVGAGSIRRLAAALSRAVPTVLYRPF